MRRALVTGAQGFIGRHLVHDLRERGIQVTPLVRRLGADASAFVLGEVPWCPEALARLIVDLEPDVVFHLAGRATGSLTELHQANVDLAAALIQALRDVELRPALIISGSAAEYGTVVVDGEPVAETATCAPTGDYGATKLAQTHAVLDFGEATGTRVLVTRIFNPIGPGMPDHLALSEFTRQILALRGKPGTLRTGNLDVWRDFMDVRDTACALRLLAENPKASGIVNICSGRPTLLRGLVEALIRTSGADVTILPDASRQRPGERAVVIGATERLTALGAALPARDLKAVVARLWQETKSQWTGAA